MNILCIDIGGTRIKSAVLPRSPSLAQAKTAASLSIRTLGWLNHSLPDLLRPDHWAGLAAHYSRAAYDRIAVAVPRAVDEQGCFLGDDLVEGPPKVPRQLRQKFEEASGRPVTLIRDADAWMFGFIRYAELMKMKIEYPVLLLAFGTGLGVTAATNAETVHGIDISLRPVSTWRKTCERATFDMRGESWRIHQVLGRHYFEWVEQERRDWSYTKMREEFSARVEAMVEDFRPEFEDRLGHLRTLVLAGGNAEFVSVRGLAEAQNCRVIALTERETALKPDLISLLGVEASARCPFPKRFD